MAYGLDEIRDERDGLKMSFYKFWNEDKCCEWYDKGKCAKDIRNKYLLPERDKNVVGPWRVYRKELEDIFSNMEDDFLNSDPDEETACRIRDVLDQIEDLL